MHNAWGSYPIFFRTLIRRSLSSVCWWKARRFFLVLCAIMKLCRGFGLFGTFLSFGSLIFFVLLVCIIGYLIPWCIFIDIFRVMFSPLGILFHLVFLFQLVLVLESLKHAYLLHAFHWHAFFLWPIYRGNSTKSQIGWDVHEIQFHIHMHIFMWSLSYVLLVL